MFLFRRGGSTQIDFPLVDCGTFDPIECGAATFSNQIKWTVEHLTPSSVGLPCTFSPCV